MFAPGRLRHPHHRHGARRLDLGQTQGARPRQHSAQRRFRRRQLCEIRGAAALRGRRLHRPGDFRRAVRRIGSGEKPHSLSRHSTQHVCQRRAGTEKLRSFRERAGHRGEALWPRSGERPGARPHPASGLRRVFDIPNRSLPRQGGGAEHSIFPLCQHVSRADLESRIHPRHPDHHGREFRRARAAAPSTKRSAPFATWCRIICCR